MASLFSRKPPEMPDQDSDLLRFMPALEAARQRTVPHRSRLLLFALCLTFLLLLVWASQAELEEVVSGPGQVVPSQRVQHIQNLEGGILREILVVEGQRVSKDDVLLRIDNEAAGSLYRDSLVRARELEVSIARLRAELDGSDPVYPPELLAQAPDLADRHNQLLQARRARADEERAALQSQLRLRKMEEQELLARRRSTAQGLDLARRQLALAEKLMATRSFSEMEYLRQQQQVAQLAGELSVLDSSIPKVRAAISEAEEKLGMHQAGVQAAILQELNEASAELEGLRESQVASRDRVRRTEVLSPVNGVIKSIGITTPGGVIMPGQTIMDVVPSDDSLIMEARIRPQDRAFLYEGQQARIRLTSYDFSIYGALDAVLEHISADTIEGRQGEIYYLARLRTLETTLEHNGRSLPIMPGMMGSADIITGKRTVLVYLLKPLLKAASQALREP